MNSRRKWLAILAGLLGAYAAYRAFIHAEHLSSFEEGSGTLTGPMINLAMLGAAIFLLGAVGQLWLRRAGMALTLTGLALTLPFYSWMFFAGAWCAATPCYGKYPLFKFHPYSAVTLSFAVASIAFQWIARRRP